MQGKRITYVLRAAWVAALALAACTTTPEPARQPRQPVQTHPPVTRAPVPPSAVTAPAPKPKPTWTARKVVPDAVEVPGGSVTVAPGDSLSRIASRTGAGIGAIAVANNLKPPYVLTPGQVLQIPAGRYHRVKEGETGIAIARAYGVEWDKIVTANQLTPPYNLRVGQKLRLPTREAVAAMTLEERARAFTIDIDDLISGSEPAQKTPPKPKAKVTPQQASVTAVAEPAAFKGRFRWPLEGRIISSFGPKAGGRYNDGINIKTTTGTPIRAAADGVVAYADSELAGFGGLVLVKHGDGWVTAYAHAEELLVSRGDRVKQGDILARAGSTGSVDEPQLHFEIRRGRTPVDPLKHLPPR